MIEARKDLFKFPCHWIAITTNGIVKDSGEAVMGAGCALEAAQKFYDVPFLLGDLIKKHGNNVHLIKTFTRDMYVPKAPPEQYQMAQVVVSLFSFPTKHHYRDKSDIALIERSCQQLKQKYDTTVFVNKNAVEGKGIIPTIAIPRAGCGYGGLEWRDVKPIFEKYFTTDNWVVVHK